MNRNRRPKTVFQANSQLPPTLSAYGQISKPPSDSFEKPGIRDLMEFATVFVCLTLQLKTFDKAA